MAFFADYHLHSKYSFDGEMELDNIADMAISNGFNEIAITDHCDLALQQEKIAKADFFAFQSDIIRVKEKYKGKLSILSGIELGQPTENKTLADSILAKHDFDVVLGSLHWIPDYPDFYYIEYDKLSDEYLIDLWKKYLDVLYIHVNWGKNKFNVLTHILYPLRYYLKSNRGNLIEIEKYRDAFADIFSLIIKNDIALEINSQRIRFGEGMNPTEELVKLYLDIGGKYITVGSDAHIPEAVCSNIKNVYHFLKANGVEKITRIKNKSLYMEKI